MYISVCIYLYRYTHTHTHIYTHLLIHVAFLNGGYQRNIPFFTCGRQILYPDSSYKCIKPDIQNYFWNLKEQCGVVGAAREGSTERSALPSESAMNWKMLT